MRKRLFVLLAMLLTGVALMIWQACREQQPEPVYQGKPLSEWIFHLDESHLVNGTYQPNELPDLDSRAVPFLAKYLDQRDSLFRRWLYEKLYVHVWRNLPAKIRSRMTEPVPLHRVQMNALEALEHMGPVAMPALPTVIRVFREVDLLLSWRAGHTLISFSGEQPAAIAPLIGALSNTNVWIRMTAAVPLREAGVAKPEIVTAVRGCLKDPDEGVRVLASNLLQVISSTPTVDTETNP